MPNIRKGILAAALAVAALPACAAAADVPVSESLAVNAAHAFTWRDGQTNVAQFDGPVQITLDNVSMSADSAILWISPSTNPANPVQTVEVALVGRATLQHGRARRSGDRLFVTAAVRGSIQIAAEQRLARNQSGQETYQIATGMREESGLSSDASAGAGRWRTPRPSPNVETPRPPVSELPAEAVKEQVSLRFARTYSQRMPDGTLAAVFDGGLTVTIRKSDGSVTQLMAERGVVFTDLKNAKPQGDEPTQADIESAVQSVYLEGDVRILFSSPTRPDARLEADQVIYEVPTDRAVLTNAVMHTTDPSGRVPIVMRAHLMKQLSNERDNAEYRLQESALTTSSFATPTYAVAAQQTYVRRSTSDDWQGSRTTFSSKNATMDLFGAQVLWLPYIGGTVTERGFPLRSLDVGSSSKFGFFTRSNWGLFESIGRVPPDGLDLSYSVDYLADRGPAGGIDGSYRGQSTLGTSRQPTSFEGDFRSYFVLDKGVDDLGGDRADVTPPRDMRGRFRWEHQQFLPDNWQFQFRTGWVSDPTFMEQYFEDEFYRSEPVDTTAYLKHQRDSEALTLLVQLQPNDFVTTHEFAQENFEIQRLPELSYQRLGESLADDSLTLYSSNSISRLRFDRSDYNYRELGYVQYDPGLPAQGYTGVAGDYVDRGDFRQELTLPVTIDRFRVQPYIVGRYTGYDDAPDGGTTDRLFTGAGVRITTAFWKVDNAIESQFWDIHRMRHVVEPELHLFASASPVDQRDVYVFDQQVDSINDITAAQIAIRQKWQTKRGGPQNWRNVDYLTWNSEALFFGNTPEEGPYQYPNSLTENRPWYFDDTLVPITFKYPGNFHGVFFASAPESSIPRDSINNDQSWRISDSTLVVADQQYNLEESELATAAVGLAVRRGDRISYYLGVRHIAPLDSSIASFVIDYELSTRYLLGMSQSYDFGQNEYVTSSFNVTRRFDRFTLALRLTIDDVTGDTGVSLNLRPTYMSRSADTGNLTPAAQ